MMGAKRRGRVEPLASAFVFFLNGELVHDGLDALPHLLDELAAEPGDVNDIEEGASNARR